MNILAIDVGTSAVKAAVLDAATAAPLGPITHAECTYDRPTPDAAEIHAEVLWRAIAQAAGPAAVGHSVAGIGLSCLMPALILLDSADRPLGPIRLHNDRRARAIAHRVDAEVGGEFLATTGIRPLPGGCSVTSWCHFTGSDPRAAARTRHFLHANSWVAFHLTGERAFDRGNASFTGLFHTTTDRQWSPRWCDFFGVDRAWLPPVVCGSTTVGNLRAAVAGELGLPTGLPVKIGTADTSSGMLAAGLRTGDLLHSVGTTQVLASLTDDPTPDARRLTRLFGVGDQYVRVTHNPVGGEALKWLRKLCYPEVDEEEYFKTIVPAAIGRATDARLEPPYLGGDRLQIDPVTAGFANLTLATTRDDLLAALLNGTRDWHRASLENLGLGTEFRRVVLTGGGWQVVQKLIPAYRDRSVDTLDEGAVRGVARLFHPA